MNTLRDLLALKNPVDEAYQVDPEDALAARADALGTQRRGTLVIARADEYSVELEGEMVHLLDGEQTVRVSMEYATWIKLCQQSTEKLKGPDKHVAWSRYD